MVLLSINRCQYKYWMECKFLSNGFALSYDNIVKPCCEWNVDDEWRSKNKLAEVNLSTWHSSKEIVKIREDFKQGVWPSNCFRCKHTEETSDKYSERQNGNLAYQSLENDDITLEIRPGSVCNFACQTCWPAASSRVAQYHSKLGLLDITDTNAANYTDFEFLKPLAHRIKKVTVLGGEPFYDKNCKKFLAWAIENLTADITMFTNGSVVDLAWLAEFKGKITLVTSMDAVGKPAEYVRYGTVWPDVIDNFNASRKLVNSARVNITTSSYNLHLLEDLIDFLLIDWPDVVTFGTARGESFYTEAVIPEDCRPDIISSLERAIIKMHQSTVEEGQRWNAINALQAVIDRLISTPYCQDQHDAWKDRTKKLDAVKGISASDYCEKLASMLA